MGNREIRDAIRKLTGTDLEDKHHAVNAEVTAVNVMARTCTCMPIGGNAVTEIINVQLMAEVDDGWLLIPAVNSTVRVSWTTRNLPYISMFSAIDNAYLIVNNTIQFQGGEFGGLTKTLELQTQLNKTNALLQAMINVITGVPLTQPANVISVLQQALSSAIAGKELGDYSGIENTSVTHGE